MNDEWKLLPEILEQPVIGRDEFTSYLLRECNIEKWKSDELGKK